MEAEAEIAELKAQLALATQQNQALQLAQAPQPLNAYFNPAITIVPSCLVLPPIPPNVRFGVPHGFINSLPKFFGLPNESTLDHVRIFLRSCALQNEVEIGTDAYRMRVFPMTLFDKASSWLDHLPPNSITNWDDLLAKFFENFFPLAKRLEIEARIRSFKQDDTEDYDEAWDRFNLIISEYPTHSVSLQSLCTIFYQGLSMANVERVENAYQWQFMAKTPEAAWDAFDALATRYKSLGTDIRGRRSIPASSHDITPLKNTLEKLISKVEALSLQQTKAADFQRASSDLARHQALVAATDFFPQPDLSDPLLDVNAVGFAPRNGGPWYQNQAQYGNSSGNNNPDYYQSANSRQGPYQGPQYNSRSNNSQGGNSFNNQGQSSYNNQRQGQGQSSYQNNGQNQGQGKNSYHNQGQGQGQNDRGGQNQGQAQTRSNRTPWRTCFRFLSASPLPRMVKLGLIRGA